jgi:hypothetical protein
MADGITWRNALGRCGLSEESAQFLEDEGGIDSIITLEAVPISGINELLKSLRRAAEKTPVVQGGNRPSFSYIAGVRLMAFRMWIAYRNERGQTPESTAFTELVMARFVTRLNELYELKASDETTGDLSGPPKLKSFEDWETWLELLTTQLSHVRNSTLGTPFTYLIREVREPELWTMTPAARTPFLLPWEQFSLDEDLVATSRFDGASFRRDNNQLFDSLKRLTIDGSCWTFIERYKTSRNGRAAFLMLKKQAEGDHAQTAKKNQAYLLIEKAHFSGKSKFTLAQYTSIHQSAHNKLEACGEPVPETKKVTDYLLGITADVLTTAKNITHSRNDLSTNFATCQQFMQSTYGKMQVAKGGARSIGGVDTNPAPKRQAHRPFPKKKAFTNPKKNRHYPKDVWKKMVESGEAKTIMDARKAKTEQRMAASAHTTDNSTLAATLASLAKTVSALAAKSGVTISSVTSKTEDDTNLSVITGDGAITPKVVVLGDAPKEKVATLVTNEKKKHPPGETTKARLESAGGQFGRNGIGNLNKQSFPVAAVKAATGVTVSSVTTKPATIITGLEPPLGDLTIADTYVESSPTYLGITEAVTTPKHWLKPTPKKASFFDKTPFPKDPVATPAKPSPLEKGGETKVPSPRRAYALPLVTNKRKQGKETIETRAPKPRKAKKLSSPEATPPGGSK